MSDTSTPESRDYEGVKVPAPGTFELDPAHSSVSFTVRHLMVSKVRGHFTDFAGTIIVAEDPAPVQGRGNHPGGQRRYP